MSLIHIEHSLNPDNAYTFFHRVDGQPMDAVSVPLWVLASDQFKAQVDLLFPGHDIYLASGGARPEVLDGVPGFITRYELKRKEGASEEGTGT